MIASAATEPPVPCKPWEALMPASLKRQQDMEAEEAAWLVDVDAATEAPRNSVDQPEAAPSQIEARARNCARSVAKRVLDIVLAGAVLLFLSPLLILIACAISVESRGPVLFRQKRGGLNGAPFVILKFRSMECDEPETSVSHASRNDTRVTRVGTFLRRSSLDELPQLINVLKGEMSLVGPRPHAVVHDSFYRAHIPDYDRRSLVRPGLTGLAQVSGSRGEIRSVADMAARVELDVAYIRTWSFSSDLSILARTLLKVPFDPAAY